jgi:hypothetical protein
MNHYDKDLKMYADSGLRTAEDWNSLGRAIDAGTKPQVEAVNRGAMVLLYSRNQTRILRGGRDRRAAPATVERK